MKHAAYLGLIISIGIVSNAFAGDTNPTTQLKYWSEKAGTVANPGTGKLFFTQTHGKDWSCASCHGNPPISVGKHASTNKVIPALAPSSNADAFTETAKIEKWFRRNCNDVLARECTPQEKANVLAYLISLTK
jgi:hypothetical protein